MVLGGYETRPTRDRGNRIMKFSSYMIPTQVIKELTIKGYFQLLETDRKILLPTSAHIKISVTSVDVLHSWAVPSFGIKIDACPGRLNRVFLNLKRLGLFFGQCSEICGSNHGFMPIVALGMKYGSFFSFM